MNSPSKILYILLLESFVLFNSKITNAQEIDSISIATFFSPQNKNKINENSVDSVLKQVGNNQELEDNFYYHQARFYLQTGDFKEAEEIANARLKKITFIFPDFYQAKYYNIIGSIHANQQEPQKAIFYFEKALRLSEDAQKDTYAAMMESNIANMYFSLVDYESAYKHAFKGFQLMKAHPLHPFYSNLLAILSISEAKVGKMNDAKEHGKAALEIAEKKEEIVPIIVANLALGEVANSEEEYDEAKIHLITSLELSEKYGQKPFIILNSIGLMVANLGTKEYSRAVEFGEKAINLVDKGGDQTTTYSIKKHLAAAYFGINQTKKAYQLLNESHQIFRSINSIENKKAINDILIKYDAEKKEKELIASNNKLLEKKIEQQNLLILLVSFGCLSILLISIIAYIRYRNKGKLKLLNSRQEKELLQAAFEGEEIERERIALELHDGVASNLTAARYQLMANKNISDQDKGQLESILLQAHEDTRRLSHKLAPIAIDELGFDQALKQFAKDTSREKCSVSFSLIPKKAFITNDQAIVLYRVAQELTQNAIKHANASDISIQVLIGEHITLIVEDDGEGFDFEENKESNGMRNLARRAKQLNGKFEIDSSPNHGTIATFII